MILIEILLTIICLLITVAFYTLTERKLIAAIQRRKGPNIVGGPGGLLQPLVDGLKAILKEQTKPLRNLGYFFILAPFICFLVSLILVNFMNLFHTSSHFDDYLNTIFFISISSFNVFGIIFAG